MCLTIRTDLFSSDVSFKNVDNALEDPITFIVELVHPKRNISEIDEPYYNNNPKRCRQEGETEEIVISCKIETIQPITKTKKEFKDTTKIFSNNMKNAVKTKCKLCKNDVTLSAMRCHTKKTHSMTITEYKEKYGELDIINPVYHKCAICSAVMILDSDNIASHLRKRNLHNTTFGAYNQKFLVDNFSFPVYTMTDLQNMEFDDFMKVLDNVLNVL